MSHAKRFGSVLSLALLCAVGCRNEAASSSPDVAASSASRQRYDEPGRDDDQDQAKADPSASPMAPACPMDVPNTTVIAVNTDDGVAIVFRTDDDGRDELRRRVQAMAQRHEAMHGEGRDGGMGSMSDPSDEQSPGDEDSMHGPGHGHGRGMMKMPPSTATAEDTDDGVQLVLWPLEEQDLALLREHAREMVAKMKDGQCPMMATQAEQE